MQKIKIIQTSPEKTGSKFLSNILYGFINNSEILENIQHSSKTIPKDIIENKLIIESYDTNIDSWIDYQNKYKLYFICTEKDSKIINQKFKLYSNVLCINYNEILETKFLNLNTIINNLYIKIRNFLPTEINMNIDNALSRITLNTSKILYIHFHKCAGTSVIDKIKKKYKPYNPSDINGNPLKKINKSLNLINFSLFDTIDLYEFLLSDKFDFFCLEFSFFNHKVIIPKNLKIYTVLRNSYTRLLSNYSHETSLSRPQSAINRGYKINNFNDFQTININYKNTLINLFNKNNYYIKFLNGFTKDTVITTEHYEQAMEIIKKFSYIAILEDKNSLCELCDLLHFNDKNLPFKNKKKNKDSINIPINNFSINNKYDILLYNTFRKNIPFFIHQSWKSEDIRTYADGKTGIISQSRWKKLYPDFYYMFWTDNDIKTYINNQSLDIINTFNELDKNIKKMDFFRYLILYEYGGIYSDMDFIPNKRIPNNLFENDFVGYKASRNHRNHYLDKKKKYSDKSYTIKDKDGKWVLGQAFFMCKKKFNGIKLIIDDIIKNKNCNFPPLHHTGPEKFHKIFVNANILNDNNVKIFSKKEINNKKGLYGFHLRKHQW